MYGNRSLGALGLMLLAAQEFHPGVLLAMDLGQTAAWMIVLMAALLAALLLWPAAAAIARIPGGDLLDLIRLAAGRWAVVSYSVLLSGLLCLIAGIVLRQTSEMALSSSFPHTPETFATTLMLLGAVHVAYGGSDALVRAGRIILVPLFLALMLIFTATQGWGNLRYLLPFWGPGPLQLVLRTPVAAVYFAPLVLLLLLAGGVNDHNRVVRPLLATPLIAGVLYAVCKASLLTIFAYPTGTNITYPMHAAVRLIIGGRFFERMEGFWLFIWVMSTIVYIGGLMHGSSLLISRAFGMGRHTVAIPALAGVVLTLAFFPRNQAETISLHTAAAPTVMAVTLVLPALFALVAALRGRLP